jgi:branched-chain amino acid transport system ATP-binding protein
METPNILEVDRIEIVYSDVILAVRNVSLKVPTGSIVALLGSNGAGKTTTLKAISKLIHAERGLLTRGNIIYDGSDATPRSANELVKSGVVQVLEGRRCFAHLSVEENLRIGAFVHRPSRSSLAKSLERIYHYFPRLKTKRSTLAGYTSGGEQQMVAIGRALIAAPKLMLLDEPSMGLAPQVVEEIFEIIRELNVREKLSVLLAEQNVGMALRYADFGYVIENGCSVTHGTTQTLRGRDDVRSFYLGRGNSRAAA